MSKRSSQNKGTAPKRKAVPKKTVATGSRSQLTASVAKEEMMFDKQNYLMMGLSLVVILIGFMLMSGGNMPSPDVWDESIIYSFRRITLAPFVVLVGLVIMIVAIFKK